MPMSEQQGSLPTPTLYQEGRGVSEEQRKGHEAVDSKLWTIIHWSFQLS